MNGSRFNSSRSVELAACQSFQNSLVWWTWLYFWQRRFAPSPRIELPISGLCRLITGVRQNLRPQICLFGNKPRPPPRTSPPPFAVPRQLWVLNVPTSRRLPAILQRCCLEILWKILQPTNRLSSFPLPRSSWAPSPDPTFLRSCLLPLPLLISYYLLFKFITSTWPVIWKREGLNIQKRAGA